jgi:2-polyprenyl-3-methyl-5-hydroxy-6-metoxy-1,4-benzoquinol methylase
MDYTQPVPEPTLALNGSIVQDYAEFSGQDIYDIFEKMNTFHELNTADFVVRGDVHKFYEDSNTYIYDLLTAHADLGGVANKLNKFIGGFMHNIKTHPGKKFLEFGGGIGDFCQIMATWGEKDVTYIDIQSHTTDFARWRFAKYNVPVKVQIIPQEDFELTDTYDIIFQDAVLEHLPPAKQLSYTRKLCEAVQPNGLFIMIVDLSGENPDMPMHYNVNINLVHDVIKECGFENNVGFGQFASVWTKVK